MDKIECDYEALEAIGTAFMERSEQSHQLFKEVLACVQDLYQGGWVSEAADAFYAEMEERILPALTHAKEALAICSEVTRQIAATFQDAEEEAQRQFDNLGAHGAIVGAGISAGVSAGNAAGGGNGADGGAKPTPTPAPKIQPNSGPGDPNVWMPLRDKAGHNQHRVAGCTAKVASMVHIPWGPPLGDAHEWNENAQKFMNQPGNAVYGMTINNTPAVGAVVCWEYNHVGYITEVDPNNPNRVRVAQGDTSKDANGNWNQPWGTWINDRDEWIDLSIPPHNGAHSFIHMPWSSNYFENA